MTMAEISATALFVRGQPDAWMRHRLTKYACIFLPFLVDFTTSRLRAGHAGRASSKHLHFSLVIYIHFFSSLHRNSIAKQESMGIFPS